MQLFEPRLGKYSKHWMTDTFMTAKDHRRVRNPWSVVWWFAVALGCLQKGQLGLEDILVPSERIRGCPR